MFFFQSITNHVSAACLLQQPCRAISKHWNPKFKKLRARKVVKFDLPNLQENADDLSTEEIRSRMKEKGILPPRHWMERPFFISCTGGIFEGYVPPEGDGKLSMVSRSGAYQKYEFLEKKSKSMMAVRKIRSFEDEFDAVQFAQSAQDIYVKAHETLSKNNKYEIRKLITERAYPEMMYNVRYKTIHWKFIKSLEAPRVVHARCTDIISKENIFAQITVRFHTQQVLAIYDRFGRLMHGSEILAKDVLEYVVFEKHLSNEYGVWRIHDKIIPDWMPPKPPSPITYFIEDTPVSQIESTELAEESPKTVESGAVGTSKPQLVTS